MQSLKLPITIDPYKSAQRRLVCEGYFEVSEMDRLLDACETCDQHINVKVAFSVDELGLVVITGEGRLDSTLLCQRCNEPLETELGFELNFSPVKNQEAADDLPSYYDAIELDENGEVKGRNLSTGVT